METLSGQCLTIGGRAWTVTSTLLGKGGFASVVRARAPGGLEAGGPAGEPAQGDEVVAGGALGQEGRPARNGAGVGHGASPSFPRKTARRSVRRSAPARVG